MLAYINEAISDSTSYIAAKDHESDKSSLTAM